MLNNIFNPENGFFRTLSLLVDVAAFSMLWLMCAATVVLLGPGTTALYDAMARNLRKGELGGCLRFWESMKANFKVACPAGVVVFATGYGLLKLHGALFAGAAADNHGAFALYAAFWVCLAVICGAASYFFPLLSRFEFGLGGLLATGVRLAFAHPLVTVALGLLTVGCMLLCIAFWWPGLAAPYVWARLACLLLEPIFKPFMEEQGKTL